MPARMTAAAWRRGFKNALVCGVAVFAFLGMLTLAISSVFGQPIRSSFAIAFGICWVLIFGAFLFSWLYAKNASGSVVLDCGPHPAKLLFLVSALLFLLVGTGFVSYPNMFGTFGTAGILFGVTVSIFWVIMAFGRLQIREHGIWQYCGLLKWDKLEGHHWEGTGDCTLMLRARSKLPFLGKGALPVPAEHKSAVDELIKAHTTVAT